MPRSSWDGKEYIRFLIGKIKPKSALDVGAGAGTYRDLLDIPHFDAVEIWAPYVERFGLIDAYREVFIEDVRRFAFDREKYDLIIFGDVLEHMTKNEAISVVSRALHSGAMVLVSIPIIDYPQGECDGNPFEAHVKPDWSHEEFVEAFGPHIAVGNNHGIIGIYMLSIGDKDRIRAAHLEITADNHEFRLLEVPI